MEEKKHDLNSMIGFALIGAILLYMMYQNKPISEEVAVDSQSTENKLVVVNKQDSKNISPSIFEAESGNLGDFSHSSLLSSPKAVSYTHLTLPTKRIV